MAPQAPLTAFAVSGCAHLREGEGDHREVDALPADRDEAEHEAEEGADEGTGEHAKLRCPAEGLHAIARDVRGEAEEGRVAEGEQAGEAEQQIERAGKEGEAQELHHEDRVQADQRRHQQQREQGDICEADGRIAQVRVSPEATPAANPAFDVTPARLVTGLITERGVAKASREGLKAMFPERG